MKIIRISLIMIFCFTILSGCSDINSYFSSNTNVEESSKPTYPFEVELIYPMDYVSNDAELKLQLKLIPDTEADTAIIKYICYEGIELISADTTEIKDFITDQVKMIDFSVSLKDKKGSVECLIEVFNKEKEKIYIMKRELSVISTEDGILCSTSDDYGGLALRHLDKLKKEGRISNSEYKKLKKEINRGGAKIESSIENNN